MKMVKILMKEPNCYGVLGTIAVRSDCETIRVREVGPCIEPFSKIESVKELSVKSFPIQLFDDQVMSYYGIVLKDLKDANLILKHFGKD